jgi:hypothetical protein
MHYNFAPKFNGRYLSSNVNLTISDKNGKNVSVPVGSASRPPIDFYASPYHFRI